MYMNWLQRISFRIQCLSNWIASNAWFSNWQVNKPRGSSIKGHVCQALGSPFLLTLPLLRKAPLPGFVRTPIDADRRLHVIGSSPSPTWHHDFRMFKRPHAHHHRISSFKSLHSFIIFWRLQASTKMRSSPSTALCPIWNCIHVEYIVDNVWFFSLVLFVCRSTLEARFRNHGLSLDRKSVV